jgi:PTS system N-acetylglucosamine-specific IIC component
MDLATPGRGDSVALVSKADYKASKEGSNSNSKMATPARVNQLLDNLGGMENLDSIDACITRLRLTVNDRNKVNDAGLKAMGAMGIVGNSNAIQVIFGAEADAFKVQLLKIRRG